MDALIAWLGGAEAVTRALAIGLLVAARIGPVAVLAPWLALRGTGVGVRGAIVVTLTVALTPLAMGSAPEPPPEGIALLVATAREMVVGTVFGLATALPLLALDWAGQLVDTWRGASLSEALAPLTGTRTSPLGHLYLLLGVALFVTLGGHRLALRAFADGLRVAPVGVASPGADWGAVALGAARLSGSALGFALAIAAPAAVTLVLVEVGLGLVARAAPQVPVFFAGMPLRAAVGIAALLLGLSFAVGEMPGAFRDGVDAALSLLRSLG